MFLNVGPTYVGHLFQFKYILFSNYQGQKAAYQNWRFTKKIIKLSRGEICVTNFIPLVKNASLGSFL